MTTLLWSIIILATTITSSSATISQPIPAIYVFGDSTVDPGNNDYIPSLIFRADHPPYGESFPYRVPTGRFSDGLLATDYLADFVGLIKLIPAYLDPNVRDEDLLTGVSFASAGSGLDDLTIKVTHAIKLTAQVENFKEAIDRMERAVGGNKMGWIVENAVFVISVGSNDMLINYYDLPTRRLMFSSDGYSDFLISKLPPIIQSLYELGARRFVVVGLPPLGCVPVQVSLGSISHGLQRVCVDKQNLAARVYNDKLRNSLNELQSQHPDARFTYGDIYTPLMDMITTPSKYGFEVTLEGCCGSGRLEAGTLCSPVDIFPLCKNASAYAFFDSIHPTQAAYQVIANSLKTILLPKLLN